jgi:GNAT superfamily N-acetyltransferase
VTPSGHPRGISIARLHLDRHRLDEVAWVATEAFCDDPFFSFLMPSPSMRRRGLRIFFRSVVATSRRVATVYGARGNDGALVGVAAFIEPDGLPLPFAAQASQLGSAVRALIPRPRAIVDGSRYLLATENAHPHERMWYLQLLAVDPNRQRGGIGGALQERVYPDVDGEGLDCYLETQKEDNLAYYRRFGYEVEAELHPVPKGPPLWTMRRLPRHPAG